MRAHSRLPFITLSSLALISSAGWVCANTDPAKEAADLEFFEKKVRPILIENCYSCHSAETKPSGGLRVDDLHGLLMGGDEGPAVVAGNPDKSLLLQRLVIKNEARRMPKESDPLTAEQIEILTIWIQNGAAWPRERIPASLTRAKPEFDELKQSHWAWQPLKAPSAPQVKNSEWPRTDIDRFVLAKLEERQLAPVGDADRLTLLRRITFDLTGLPPTPVEIATFQEDENPDAFAKVVDRLLQSPQFAERWGRHWLDVARYGESTGPSRNIPYPHAWKYRDYVIDAVNRDIPYDKFIQEQIAGDLLFAESSEDRDRLLTATGFLALGVKDVNQRFKVRFVMDNVDEQIDAVTRSVLGLTVSCARCHDHKFDPIPVTDYYALAGIFTSTDDCAGVRNKMGGGGLDYYNPAMLITLDSNIQPAPKEQVEALQAKVNEAKKAWDEIRGTPEGLEKLPNGQPKQRAFRTRYERAQADLLALSDPASRGYAVHGVREAEVIADTEVRIRGEAERLGPKVPRGFLTVFEVPGAESVNPAQSGRLQLAQWLTSPANPMTPRVMVNRVWKNLFGQGIVNTVDNFGVTGDVPSHPELLDYLATEFIKNGWSVKQLIRTVVLSRAYQLGSDAPESLHQIDPANRLIWRHSPRRLDAEELRDGVLASSGRLISGPAAEAVVKNLRMVEMRDNGAEAKLVHDQADTGLFRSIYLPALRGVTPKALEAFDPVTQSLVTGQRDATTVPTQALFMLNSAFVRQQALALAEQVLRDPSRFDLEWIEQIYLLTLGRPPSEQEVVRAQAYLVDYQKSYTKEAPVVAMVSASAESRGPDDDTQAAATTTTSAPTVVLPPANPDDVDRTDALTSEIIVEPKTPKAAAWMSLVQALFASAEFRFVR